MAELMLFITDRKLLGEGRLSLSTLVAIAAFANSMWALYGAGAGVVMWGTLLMLVVLRIFAWMKWLDHSGRDTLARSIIECRLESVSPDHVRIP
jgi:hypothetical protein